MKEEETGSCRCSCVMPSSPLFVVCKSRLRCRAVVRGCRSKVKEISPVAFVNAASLKRFRCYLLPEQCCRVISPSIAAAAAPLEQFLPSKATDAASLEWIRRSKLPMQLDCRCRHSLLPRQRRYFAVDYRCSRLSAQRRCCRTEN